MSKVINCECGETVRGESEDEVIANAEAHVQRDHPELVGQMSRSDFAAMVEDG